jgi:hypothetical protein
MAQQVVRSAWQAQGMRTPLSGFGVVLIVLGLAALGYQGFRYTTRDTVLDIGPIHATTERTRWMPLPPVLGAGAIVAGVAVLALGMRKAA